MPVGPAAAGRPGRRLSVGEACDAAGVQLRGQWRALITAPRELFVVYVIKWLTSYSCVRHDTAAQQTRPIAQSLATLRAIAFMHQCYVSTVLTRLSTASRGSPGIL